MDRRPGLAGFGRGAPSAPRNDDVVPRYARSGQLVAYLARGFALTVQDRVIRLEMRLRLQALAPDPATRFDEFTSPQITALRFAGDAELPALARQVIEGKLTKSVDIKKQVRNWKADNLRV